MTESLPGSASGPSGNSSQTPSGLPSEAEIIASVERLKEQRNGRTQETARPPEEIGGGEDGREEAGDGEPSALEQAGEDGAAAAEAAPAAAEGEGAGGDGGKPDGGEQRRTLKEMADQLKTSANSLYKMEVPLNDGTGRRMSVEDLKAGYLAGEGGQLDAQRHEFTQEKALYEKQRIDRENEVLRSSRELQEVMGLVTGLMPPEQLARYRQQAQQNAAQEARRLLEAIPEFGDQTVYQGWMRSATDLLGKYGFSEAEANNIADHRVYKVLNDHMRLLKRIEALEALPEEIKTPPRSVRRHRADGRAMNKKAALDKARRTGAEADKVTAARMIIEGALRK